MLRSQCYFGPIWKVSFVHSQLGSYFIWYSKFDDRRLKKLACRKENRGNPEKYGVWIDVEPINVKFDRRALPYENWENQEERNRTRFIYRHLFQNLINQIIFTWRLLKLTGSSIYSCASRSWRRVPHFWKRRVLCVKYWKKFVSNETKLSTCEQILSQRVW